MYKVTRELSQYLTEREIGNKTGEIPECSYVEVCYKGENLPTITVNFYSRDDDNDVTIITDPFLSVPKERVPAVLYRINELNQGLRFMSVVMDSKDRIVLSFDVPQKTENVLEVCLEMLIRMVRVVDDVYPLLAKVAYGSTEGPRKPRGENGNAESI